MQLDEYLEILGEAYACLGRPRLEGRLVALLLASPGPIAFFGRGRSDARGDEKRPA
ncbi:MAG: hypothetical protein HZB27_03410 [Meiothermus silvanus]|nr:hypothetical protein [Allomeiothermus silvanus]